MIVLFVVAQDAISTERVSTGGHESEYLGLGQAEAAYSVINLICMFLFLRNDWSSYLIDFSSKVGHYKNLPDFAKYEPGDYWAYNYQDEV